MWPTRPQTGSRGPRRRPRRPRLPPASHPPGSRPRGSRPRQRVPVGLDVGLVVLVRLASHPGSRPRSRPLRVPVGLNLFVLRGSRPTFFCSSCLLRSQRDSQPLDLLVTKSSLSHFSFCKAGEMLPPWKRSERRLRGLTARVCKAVWRSANLRWLELAWMASIVGQLCLPRRGLRLRVRRRWREGRRPRVPRPARPGRAGRAVRRHAR